MIRQQLKSANGFIIVFDYTRKETFENMLTWIQFIERFGSCSVGTSCATQVETDELLPSNQMKNVPISSCRPLMILGNKKELNRDEVSQSDINQFWMNHSNIILFDVSARSGMNVDSAFHAFAQELAAHGRMTKKL